MDSLTSLALQNALSKLPSSNISSELLGVIANMDLPDLEVGKSLVIKISNNNGSFLAELEVKSDNIYKESIPITLKSSLGNLSLKPSQTIEINAKVVANTIDKVELKVINLKMPETPELAINDKIIVKDLANYKQTLSFAPLKLDVQIQQKPILILAAVAIDVKNSELPKQMAPLELKTLASLEAVKEKLQNIISEKIVGEVVKIPLNNQQQPIFNKATNEFILALKTPLGIVLPEKPLNMEIGAKILLSIKEIIFPELEQIIDNPKEQPIKNILNLLDPIKKEYPELVAKIIAKIPSQNPQMLSNLISFVKASEGEKIDLSQWLGKSLMQEIDEKPQIVKEAIVKMSENFNINRLENNNWRILEIPFFNGNTMSKISLAIKKMIEEEDDDVSSKNKQKSGTRFVLDTSFSKLGDFQFDGFAIKNENKFDLVLRTQKAMPKGFVDNVINIFKKSLIEVSYCGNIKINQEEDFLKVYEPQNNNLLDDGIYI